MNFLITALAVYGISALITQYDGPWGLFARLRAKLPNSAFWCAVCLSVWVVIPMILLATYTGIFIPSVFAIIGVVILLEKL